MPVIEKPKLPEPVVQNITEPVIVIVEEKPIISPLVLSIIGGSLLLVIIIICCRSEDRVEVDPDDELEKEEMQDIVHSLLSDLIQGATSQAEQTRRKVLEEDNMVNDMLEGYLKVESGLKDEEGRKSFFSSINLGKEDNETERSEIDVVNEELKEDELACAETGRESPERETVVDQNETDRKLIDTPTPQPTQPII